MIDWGELKTSGALRKIRMAGHYVFNTPCERCGGNDRVSTRLCFIYDADLCITCTREFYIICNGWSEQKELLKIRDLSATFKQALAQALSSGSPEVPHISTELALVMDRFIDVEVRCFQKAKAWVLAGPAERPNISDFRNANVEVKAQIVAEQILLASDEIRAELRTLLDNSPYRRYGESAK